MCSISISFIINKKKNKARKICFKYMNIRLIDLKVNSAFDPVIPELGAGGRLWHNAILSSKKKKKTYDGPLKKSNKQSS